MPRRYRQRPVVIEAVKWDGRPSTIFPLAPFENAAKEPEVLEDGSLSITTLQGVMVAEVGDWVIKGVEGEIYPCKDSVFLRTYEPVKSKEV